MKKLVILAIGVCAAPCLGALGCGDDDDGGETGAGQDMDAGSDSATEADGGVDPDSGVFAPEPPEPKDTTYCGGPMLELPDDPAARGPWEVGARTVEIDYLVAEVWYPALRGSSGGEEPWVYDLREYLPVDQQAGVEQADTIMQPCDCYRDLPIDDRHGPYAVIVFAHGMSGFKGQSLELMTHWASRGFVVISADAPSIGLKSILTLLSGDLGSGGMDAISGLFGQPSNPEGECDPAGATGQTGDLVFMLDALKSPTGDLAFLEGRIDLGRIGATGHSAGGMAVFSMGGYPGVKVVIPMAAGGVCDGAYLESTVVIGGVDDSIVSYTGQQQGYESSPAPRRLIGLANAGHMAMTSFCPIGEEEGGIIEAAKGAGVVFSPVFESLITPLASDGCGPDSLAPERGWEIINFATSAAFEQVLMCIPERGDQLSAIASRYPEVGEFREQL